EGEDASVAADQGNSDAWPARERETVRASVGKVRGLDWPATYVLKAICDLALELGVRRLTTGDVEHRLPASESLRRSLMPTLDVLTTLGYVSVDDAPHNCYALVYLLSRGLEEYAQKFVPGYEAKRLDLGTLVAREIGR